MAKRILIVGGGIGGLTLAAYLRKQGTDVVLVEKTREWKTIGYVLGIFPNGLKILDGIGLAKPLIEQSVVLPGHTVQDDHGNVLARTSFNPFREKFGPLIETERDTLHRLLREHPSGTDIRMGTTVDHLEEHDEKVYVTFNDGKKESFDLVVGADGINSQIREYVRPHATKDYSGIALWLMWIKNDGRFSQDVVYEFGEAKGVALFPCKSHEHIAACFVMRSPPHQMMDGSRHRQFLREHFHDQGSTVKAVLEMIPDEPAAILHNDDSEMHVRTWYRGRVVLLGDAVHALSPVLGMGASMAMEDAFVLADALCKNADIPHALACYKRRRFPRVRTLARWSWVIHRTICMRGLLAKLRNFCMKTFFVRSYFKNIDRFLAEPI